MVIEILRGGNNYIDTQIIIARNTFTKVFDSSLYFEIKL